MLNLAHRASHETPSPLVPDEPAEATVTLDQCAYRVPAGHRLRVAVSTAYWPMIWPSPEAATVTLASGSLSLPVRPSATGDECSFPEPEAAAPWAVETIRPEKSERRIERDLESGIVTVVVANDFGAVRASDHGLVSGSRMIERWSIDPGDPSSARGEIRWEQELSRGDWSVRTVATSTMMCNPVAFELAARLEAFEGDTAVFSRDYAASVPRRLV